MVEYECDHEGLIRRLQDLIEKKQKMIDSLTSRITTQVKLKRQECSNANDKLVTAKRELATLKKNGVKTEGERIADLEEKIKAQVELNQELSKEFRSLKH